MCVCMDQNPRHDETAKCVTCDQAEVNIDWSKVPASAPAFAAL